MRARHGASDAGSRAARRPGVPRRSGTSLIRTKPTTSPSTTLYAAPRAVLPGGLIVLDQPGCRRRPWPSYRRRTPTSPDAGARAWTLPRRAPGRREAPRPGGVRRRRGRAATAWPSRCRPGSPVSPTGSAPRCRRARRRAAARAAANSSSTAAAETVQPTPEPVDQGHGRDQRDAEHGVAEPVGVQVHPEAGHAERARGGHQPRRRRPRGPRRANDRAGVVPRTARQAASTPVPMAAPASRVGDWVATAPAPTMRGDGERGERPATAADRETDGQQHTERRGHRLLDEGVGLDVAHGDQRAGGSREAEQPQDPRGHGRAGAPAGTWRLLVAGMTCVPARGARARAGCSGVRASRCGCALRRPGTLSTLGTPGRIPPGYMRRLANEGLVRRTPLTASRSITASSTAPSSSPASATTSPSGATTIE